MVGKDAVDVVHQAAHAVAAARFGVPVPPVKADPGTKNCDKIALPAAPTAPLDLTAEFVLKAHAVVSSLESRQKAKSGAAV